MFEFIKHLVNVAPLTYDDITGNALTGDYVFKLDRGIYQYGYLHIGGSIMSMDFSADRKTLIVGSFNGQIAA